MISRRISHRGRQGRSHNSGSGKFWFCDRDGIFTFLYSDQVVKNDYAPFTTTVTIEKDRTTSLTATLNNDDLEGDGLLDDEETNGFIDGFGNRHTTDPYLLDTDGDGLSDGYEAGEPVTENGKTFRKQRSDPTKADTDGDGLDDYLEDYDRCDPYDPDSDHDGIPDGDDDDPRTPFYIDYISDQIHDQIAVRLGAVFGETGLKGGACYDLIGGDTYSSRPPYVGGWIVSGLVAVGDVRDLLSELSQYDTTGAALTGIGLVPVVGDVEKAGADCAKFIGKYPEAIRPLGKYLAEQGIIDWLGEGRLKFIDDFFPVGEDGVKVGTHLKAEYDLSVDDLMKLMRRGVDLSEVTAAVKVGDDVVPILKARESHYVGRHVDGTEEVGRPGTTIFPTSEPVTSYGIPYPGTSSLTREEMKEELISWIDEAIKAKRTEWLAKTDGFTYEFKDGERCGIKEIKIGINPYTGVATVCPTKGSQVYMWYSNKRNPAV